MQSEYDIKKVRFSKIQDAYNKDQKMSQLKSGQLRGSERSQAERDFAVDLHKETDQQGDIIKDIGKDLRGANENLGEIANEAQKQDKQIDRIHEKVLQGQSTVKQTDALSKTMIWRAKCTKVLLWLTNILVFIAIIVIVIIKGTNHYRCTHQNK